MNTRYETNRKELKLAFISLGLLSTQLTFAQTSDAGSRTFRLTEMVTGSDDLAPETPIFFNDKIVFSGNDNIGGRELMELNRDGQFTIIKDINPGIDDAEPRDLCNYNNYLYFTASNEPGNRELFIYDGNGTVMAVEDIFNADHGENPKNLVVFNNEMYYQATTSALGTHIRKYSGGAPSQVYYSPNNNLDVFLQAAFVFKNELYSVFAEENGNAALYKLNGLDAPELITSLGAYREDMNRENFAILNGNLYFVNHSMANKELWVYDATNPAQASQAILNSDISDVHSLKVFSNNLILAADDLTHGTELWSFDGTNEPVLLADIEEGSLGSDIHQFYEFDKHLYFTASTAEYGTELWSLDLNLNHVLVDDLNDGNAASNPAHILKAWDNLYMVANDGSTGNEFWSFCSSHSVDVIETCSAFTWIDGNTYMESNHTAKHTLTNQFGCDSIVTLDFTMVDGNNVHVVYKVDDSGEGTLRSAIQNACANDTIRFAPITDDRHIVLTNGELLINKNLTIIGNGPNKTIIDGNLDTRVFNAEANLWLSDLSITRGFDTYMAAGILTDSDLLLTNVSIQNCEVMVPENETSDLFIPPGGAAFVAMGNLCEVYGSTISGNSTELTNPGVALGPVLHISSNEGLLSIVNSSITGNNTKASSPYSSSLFAVNAYLVNTTISGNRLQEVENQEFDQTAGIVVWENLKLMNTVIWENTPEGVSEIETEFPLFIKSLIKGIDTQDFDGTETPHFVDAMSMDSAPTTDGDYKLQCLSPLVESGHVGNLEGFELNEWTYLINSDFYSTDANGDNRLMDYDQDQIEGVDIGAFENQLGNVSSIDEHFACSDFIWIDGNEYKESNNTATVIVTDEMGCNETLTLVLEISDINPEAEIQGNFITALDITVESIQWVDCNNNNEPIEGETGQTFTPASNGNYAAELIKGDCKMLTNCVGFIQTGIEEDLKLEQVNLYPNPTEGNIQIDLAGLQNVTIRIYNANGKLIHESYEVAQSIYKHNIQEAAGIYMIQIESNGASKFIKLIKY